MWFPWCIRFWLTNANKASKKATNSQNELFNIINRGIQAHLIRNKPQISLIAKHCMLLG